MKTITDKMTARGVESLSDAELLAVLTDDEQTAGALLAACGGALARIGSEDAARLRMVGGLGLRRARLLLAAAEFGRRVAASARSWKRLPMRSVGRFTSPLPTASSSASA